MAPLKRTNTPTQLPSWFEDLLREIHHLQEEFRNQQNGIGELRSIVLENQNLLLRANLSSNRARNSDQQVIPNQNIVRSALSRTPSHNIRATITRAPLTNAIRSAVVQFTPIPRATTPNPEAIAQPCWYHRQFGIASSNCIQPCSFVAPPIIPKKSSTTTGKINPVATSSSQTTTKTSMAPAKANPRTILRHPLERTKEDNVENDVQQTKTDNSMETDWNVLEELENNHPTLSESSSSSSSSEDSSSEDSPEDVKKKSDSKKCE